MPVKSCCPAALEALDPLNMAIEQPDWQAEGTETDAGAATEPVSGLSVAQAHMVK